MNKKIITSDIFVAYSQCHLKAFLLLFSENQGTPNDYTLILEKRRRSHQNKYLETFKKLHKNSISYDVKNLQGSDFFVDVRLKIECLEATCDVLSKSNKITSTPRVNYEPTIVGGTYSITKEQKIEILFIGKILGQIQKHLPRVGIIVSMDGKLHRVNLENSYKMISPYFKILQTWIKQDSVDPPALILNKHCQFCQFKDLCHEQALKENNLSLLDRMTSRAIQKYKNNGIFTIYQLSYIFRPRRNRKKQIKLSVKHSLELQALSIRENIIYFQDLPEINRKSVEIFLDIESIPDQKFYYLIGLTVYEFDSTIHYSFWANTIKDEQKIWENLIAKLNEYPEASIYHYGNYESKTIDALSKRYETEVENIKQRLININSYIYGKIYFPVFSNSLKEIGRAINFMWTAPNASGMQSIAWRYQWEENSDQCLKQKLINYNKEDCLVLKCIIDFIENLLNNIDNENNTVALNKSTTKIKLNNIFQKNEFVLNDFTEINKCSYFNYQNEKIFFRDRNKKRLKPKTDQKLKRFGQNHKINEFIEIPFTDNCPRCGHSKIYTKEKVYKIQIDLKCYKYGIKKWTRKFSSNRFMCSLCNHKWRPDEFKKIRDRYGHRVYAYMIYLRVASKQSCDAINQNLKDIFGFHVYPNWTNAMTEMSDYYYQTYEQILIKINSGKLLHADETTVDIQNEQGYVWVFTSVEEVYYIYSPSREGKILDDILVNFNGVLISDFYSVYDSIDCLQQKCLIHLIRDMNDDLYKNPFDDEFKNLSSEFGSILKRIVQTIDRFGLKKRYLYKYINEVNRFYKKIESSSCSSEIYQKYKTRFIKNRFKLFEFLNHDGIPWNNNRAESAIKTFASYRHIVGGRFTEEGIKKYLLLLSIYQTCKYKDISFFQFLFSGEIDIDKFNPNLRSSMR